MFNCRHSVAVVIDGSFFIKRYFSVVDRTGSHTAEQVARNLYTFAHKHVGADQHLYRIFYYDCFPFDKKIHNPITKKVIDFRRTDQYKFRVELFEELKKKRKVALRLGVIKDSGN